MSSKKLLVVCLNDSKKRFPKLSSSRDFKSYASGVWTISKKDRQILHEIEYVVGQVNGGNYVGVYKINHFMNSDRRNWKETVLPRKGIQFIFEPENPIEMVNVVRNLPLKMDQTMASYKILEY